MPEWETFDITIDDPLHVVFSRKMKKAARGLCRRASADMEQTNAVGGISICKCMIV
ncbi:MAG: hypothetical protein NC394_06590 [Bacteroides sp.]|nr:hypothetical protein [Bacteroides sp.]